MSKQRKEISDKYKWDLSKVYSSSDEVKADIKKLKTMVDDYLKYKGKITSSSDMLLKATDDYFALARILDKLIVYSHMKFDEDKGVSESESLMGIVDKFADEVSEKLAFYTPEVLSADYDKIKNFIAGNESLEKYSFMFEDLFREKRHILPLEQEEMMARLGEVLSSPENTFRVLDDVNLKFDDITDENGNKVVLNNSNYSNYLKSEDRNVRKEAFESLYKSYSNYKNTFASLLRGNVKSNFFVSNTRKYNSPLEMSLYSDNIDKKLYTSLIEKVHNNLDIMEEYMRVRKNILGILDVHMYDVYAPIVETPDKKIPFEKAKEMVKAGLAPMGKDYINKLQEGFDNRWIDIYENEGKRSGAYSWGAYGIHPYVLLNYQGTLDHVFTLAHEMGHALHSYYSDSNQSYINAGYKIFVAEVASTCNESLLIHYLLKNTDNKAEKAYLINHFLEQFKGTLYRQTMFAEFEKITHKMVEEGETLTSDILCKVYYDLNKQYFGEDMVLDEEIALEWARIPHFYNPFYVYQYATGISAAIALSKKIMEQGEAGVKDYMKFLTGGGSKNPIDLLKLAGVDMTTKEPIEKALELFKELLDQMEQSFLSIDTNA